MFEIKRSEQKVNGQTVETWIAEMVSANILEIEVGTTGYCGGDTGHGGRTYFRLKDLASTDMRARMISDNTGNTEEITIEFGGDTELATFIQVLEFSLKVLKEKTRN